MAVMSVICAWLFSILLYLDDGQMASATKEVIMLDDELGCNTDTISIENWLTCFGDDFTQVPHLEHIQTLANFALKILKDELNKAGLGASTAGAGALGSWSFAFKLDRRSLPEALAAFLAAQASDTASETDATYREVRQLVKTTLNEKPAVLFAILADIAKAVHDPAVESMVQAVALFKGFTALSLQRVAHEQWVAASLDMPESFKKKTIALTIQSLVSEKFNVDIHPGATFGNGIQLDHASGVVIGGTAIIGHDVYILHEVTLGASGAPVPQGMQRHPNINDHVVLGAGSTVLGSITVGSYVTVGASAIVSKSVPIGCTVVSANKQICKCKKMRAEAQILARQTKAKDLEGNLICPDTA